MFTVFTPTFNRAVDLGYQYQSLLKQTYKDFEWLVVDDGSTDNTEEVINGFIAENKIKINYIKKENGGKNSCINIGVNAANGDLFLLIDSDDWFTDNAFSIYKSKWDRIKDDENIAGMVGLSLNQNGDIIGTPFPWEEKAIHFSEIYNKYNIKGDKAVAYKTHILKQYPFPVKKGIVYVMENVVYDAMDYKYKMLTFNEKIEYKNYNPDGMSKNAYKYWMLRSHAFSYYQFIERNVHPFSRFFKLRCWEYIHLGANALLCNENYVSQFSRISDKIIYYMLFPRAFFAYLRMRKMVLKANAEN